MRWLVSLVALAVLFQARERRLEHEGAARTRSLFSLEVPDYGVTLAGDSSAVIPSALASRLRIKIQKQPSHISYGSIFAKINTESANVIMTTAGVADGIVCDLDLSRRGGFALQRGRNSVEVEVKDNLQRRYYASFLLSTSDGPAEPVPSARRPLGRVTGARWAVVVGVSRYAHAARGIPELPYASKDAAAFRDFLSSPGGGSFPPENVVFLVDAAATTQAVRSALFTFLTQVQPEDFVILYFAAHGSPDPNDRRNLYLITHDTRPEDMGGTAFPMWQLQDVLVRVIRAKRVAIFADTCHSQGISGSVYGAPAQQNNLVNQYLARFATDAKHVLIAGSDISQSSYESDRWGGGHGAFTYFLLKGLRGEADYNKDGTVSAGELYPYVYGHVKRETDGRQTPTAVAGLAEDLPLAGSGVRAGSRLENFALIKLLGAEATAPVNEVVGPTPASSGGRRDARASSEQPQGW